MFGLSISSFWIAYLICGLVFTTIFYCCTHVRKEGFWTPGWWCEYYVADKPHPFMFLVFAFWPFVLIAVTCVFIRWIVKNFGNIMRYVLGWPVFIFGHFTDTKVEKEN